jgi:hypothetical protein
MGTTGPCLQAPVAQVWPKGENGMTRLLAITAGILLLALAPRVSAGEAGEAVFAERGPWALKDQAVSWSLNVDGPELEGFLPVTDGAVTLAEVIDPSDQKPVLQLTQTTRQHSRKIGPFPINGGDPSLTYFLEQTARDMASLTGGSPFYIRNRIKESLGQGGVLTRHGKMLTAEFRPFAEDPNADRMNGFATLTLTFVMTDPHQPIREMRAVTSGDQPGYDNHMVLQ